MRILNLNLISIASISFLTFTNQITKASPINSIRNEKRDDSAVCQDYIIIQARGTGEAQGPSSGFGIMNAIMMSSMSGGNQYYVQYPASVDQNSLQGTQDIIEKVNMFSQTFPNSCLFLQGYSQGAAATVEALAYINGTLANSIKGILLIGNPLRKPNLSCNVDGKGGKSNVASMGIEYQLFSVPPTIPNIFINRTMDMCIQGDGICDVESGTGYGSDQQHSSYGIDANAQMSGMMFMTAMLSQGKHKSVVI